MSQLILLVIEHGCGLVHTGKLLVQLLDIPDLLAQLDIPDLLELDIGDR